jgi:hypothetical protein
MPRERTLPRQNKDGSWCIVPVSEVNNPEDPVSVKLSLPTIDDFDHEDDYDIEDYLLLDAEDFLFLLELKE